MLHPDAARVAIELATDLDEALFFLTTVQAEALQGLRRSAEEVGGGLAVRCADAGYDLHLPDGRWVGFAESLPEAAAKLPALCRLWGEQP